MFEAAAGGEDVETERRREKGERHERERDDVNYKEKLEREKLREVRERKKIIEALFPWLQRQQTFLDLVSLQSF